MLCPTRGEGRQKLANIFRCHKCVPLIPFTGKDEKDQPIKYGQLSSFSYFKAALLLVNICKQAVEVVDGVEALLCLPPVRVLHRMHPS